MLSVITAIAGIYTVLSKHIGFLEAVSQKKLDTKIAHEKGWLLFTKAVKDNIEHYRKSRTATAAGEALPDLEAGDLQRQINKINEELKCLEKIEKTMGYLTDKLTLTAVNGETNDTFSTKLAEAKTDLIAQQVQLSQQLLQQEADGLSQRRSNSPAAQIRLVMESGGSPPAASATPVLSSTAVEAIDPMSAPDDARSELANSNNTAYSTLSATPFQI